MSEYIESIVSDGHGSLNASYLVIHETANPNASALNHVNYWKNDDTFAVHYVADWTEKIYHCVPDDRLCWQVGNGNKYVIGIELCHATNRSAFEKVWNTGVDFAVDQLLAHGWGIEQLISHNDAWKMWGGTDHTDPDDYFEEFGRSWDEFKAEVEFWLNKEEQEEKGIEMQCLIKPDGENFMVWYDGTNLHGLDHEDEMKAIQDIYRKCTGSEIPVFEYGTKEAPWFRRFANAVNHRYETEHL